MSQRIKIFHDPTSEPSRAVHWLVLEAGIDVDIEYIWLTRGDHMSDSFLQINPLHQVPAMQHGDFCLSEATAIMNYITDVYGCSERWFGQDIKTKAVINKHLSWYHTNLRRLLTLDYFLPVLLLPAYLGFAKPSEKEVSEKKEAMAAMFAQLDGMLSDTTYLCGDELTAVDILYASDVFALQISPDYESILSPYKHVVGWLSRLIAMSSYTESHKAWNHVSPLIVELNGQAKESPRWIADTCEKLIS
ncbi:glutathione S-transferase family protein [Vibrio fortis]|uniref:Glutathione S-transferase family protein n=1 Tax=Vibrio fortis TaxID=212667 RepID=A0A5N3QTG9_9VIBR|nr:glutathione S-transferase family protein [Vibrio fortis]KAB0285433.1 glutathione S-transferase family protein [Vibrio fortis]